LVISNVSRTRASGKAGQEKSTCRACIIDWQVTGTVKMERQLDGKFEAGRAENPFEFRRLVVA
jgi:hypothetical protein